jgi:hypothetical protein
LGGKIIDKDASVLFLSFLMLLTPLANAYVFGNFMQQPKVFTQSFVKTVEVEGKKFELRCFGKVTQYSNGTELVEGSVTIENVSKHIPRLRVNLTKIITPEELNLWKGETKINEKSSIYSKDSFASSTITFTKETWDNLLFVVDSPQIWIKYKHDDNYETYHPGNFNEPWEFKPHDVYNDIQLYNEKVHTHISIADLNAAITGNMSLEEFERKYSTLGSSTVGAFIGALLGEELVAILSLTGGLAAVVAGLAAALGALLAWLLQQLGISNTSEWLKNIVQAEQGDGFRWSWGFHTTYLYAWIYDPSNIAYIEGDVNPSVLQHYSEILSQYHKIRMGFYEVREFYRTWGSQRDASPENWNSELWYSIPVPAGIFADYGSLSK